MKRNLLTLTLLVSGCATITPHSDQNTHWSYTGHEGPAHWGALDPKYSICATGVNQSPIDLTGFIESDLSPIGLAYKSGGYEVINNGHTIQVNYRSGSSLAIDDHIYKLKQFHFHSPSENHINGKSYPMEAHLVHADKNGNLAVIGVMFEEGDENKVLKEIWSRKLFMAGSKKELPFNVSADDILPVNQDYYRFNGSLTTPPCSEGVLWLVMKQPITVSKEQIQQFRDMMQQPTNRPIQPINARPVLE
jgi:carbonic anhydrase